MKNSKPDNRADNRDAFLVATEQVDAAIVDIHDRRDEIIQRVYRRIVRATAEEIKRAVIIR